MMRRKWILRFILLVFIPALIAGLAYETDRRGGFNLRQIDLVIADSAKAPHLEAWMDSLKQKLEAYRGSSLLSLPLEQISQTLKNEKWVMRYQLTRRWPNSLEVSLEPQTIGALMMDRSGSLVPILEDGTALQPIDPTKSPDLVLLDGREFLEPALRQRAVSLIHELPEVGAFSKKSVASLRWVEKKGFEAKLIEKGTPVRLGEDHFALKAARLSQVIDYLESRGLKAETLDANLSKKVLVRLHEDSIQYR